MPGTAIPVVAIEEQEKIDHCWYNFYLARPAFFQTLLVLPVRILILTFYVEIRRGYLQVTCEPGVPTRHVHMTRTQFVVHNCLDEIEYLPIFNMSSVPAPIDVHV